MESHRAASAHEPQAPAPAAPADAASERPAIRRAERKTLAPVLIDWDPRKLGSEPDPLAKGLASLLQRGAQAALFLVVSPGPNGGGVPLFRASAAVNAGPRRAVWVGLKWDPTVVPALWNQFVKTGIVELAPPDAATNVASHRNVVRAALGIGRGEWLTLVRVGPSEACRGVLAVISSGPLADAVQGAMPLLATPVAVRAA